VRGDSDYLAEVNGGKVSVFTATAVFGNTLALWQTWRRPRNASQIYIFALGSGGGGGWGCDSQDQVTNRGGGGGGVGAASCSMLIDACRVPDLMYISVAMPGIGAGPTGNGSFNGENGALSYVSVRPNSIVAADLMIQSANGGAGAGLLDITGAGGGNGGLPSIATAAGAFGMGYAHWRTTVGADMTTGSDFDGPPPDVTYLGNTITTGGAGGGGIVAATSETAGCDIAPIGRYPRLAGGLAGGGNGADGYNLLFDARGQLLSRFFMTTGGTGGGGKIGNPAVGGNGGNGGYGSGGGGGGAGHINTTQSAGNGGSGLVIIIAR